VHEREEQEGEAAVGTRRGGVEAGLAGEDDPGGVGQRDDQQHRSPGQVRREGTFGAAHRPPGCRRRGGKAHVGFLPMVSY
jgi:hypothetical protein